MWFGILGSLLVRDGDVEITIPGARQRVVLAALLMRAGTVIPPEALAELVWDEAPPAGAPVTLRSHVLRLRRALGPGPGSRVLTRSPGYLLKAGTDEVDLLRFRVLCREGAAAARTSDWARACALLDEALGLWRGTPLNDVPSELLRREELPGLEEMRLRAEEWWIDASLHLGRHPELMPVLRARTARHPLRERFHAQLMLALYRDGRQAEALRAYQDAHQVLAAELGTEPGPELRKLQRQILSGDPALDIPGPAPGASIRPGVPRELPPDVPHFTGRAAELAALTTLLDQSAATAIAAIGGMAGVGKTALAVHWAHRLADRFPDGQLYVNLRGYDPGRPVSAGDALARFLRALGEPGQEIPAEEDERAARYRSLLAERRMLVVLDNAASAEQARPLLPGSPSCTVLVTSRDALAGLIARDGATRLDLDVLAPDETVGLLRVLIGDRAGAEPDAVVALAGRCCQLPLALRVAAEVAASRPVTPLAVLAAELDDQRNRLDLLAADSDPRTAVRSVFSWSCRQLAASPARAFRLLGLHPGTDFGPYALAALTGGTAEQAGQALGLLARAHLIQPARSGRYGMHDLLRVYAGEMAAEDSAANRRAALTGLFDHYLHTAAAAMDTLYPAERDRRPRVPPASAAAPPVTDPAAARHWLDAERGCLVAAAAYAADHGWPGHATGLAATLFRYLEVAGHFPELTALCDSALRAARGAGDRPAEARALHDAVVVDLNQGRYEQAAAGLRQALALYRELGDRMHEASTLDHLGIASYLQGRCGQAARYHEQALVLYQQGSNPVGQARALNNLGLVELQQGHYDRAAARFLEVLDQPVGDQANEVNSLANLGIAGLRQGRYQQAAEYLHRALALSRQTGNPIGECYSLTNLALADLGLGRHQEAVDRLQQALALSRKHGAKSGEAEALNCLGDVLLATGQPAEAHAQYATALTLARQIHDKQELARAHSGLGHALHAMRDPGQARRHWQQALSLYEQLGAPEAAQLRAGLAATPGTNRTPQ